MAELTREEFFDKYKESEAGNNKQLATAVKVADYGMKQASRRKIEDIINERERVKEFDY